MHPRLALCWARWALAGCCVHPCGRAVRACRWRLRPQTTLPNSSTCQWCPRLCFCGYAAWPLACFSALFAQERLCVYLPGAPLWQGKAILGRLEGADTSSLAAMVVRYKDGGSVALVPPVGGVASAATIPSSDASLDLNDRLRTLIKYGTGHPVGVCCFAFVAYRLIRR